MNMFVSTTMLEDSCEILYMMRPKGGKRRRRGMREREIEKERWTERESEKETGRVRDR